MGRRTIWPTSESERVLECLYLAGRCKDLTTGQILREVDVDVADDDSRFRFTNCCNAAFRPFGNLIRKRQYCSGRLVASAYHARQRRVSDSPKFRRRQPFVPS